MKKQEFRYLQVRQLDDRLSRWRHIRATVPRLGWIRTIREALGMTTSQLADRLEVTQSTASRLEKSEQEGSITIASLTRAANALGCDLVYVLLPRDGTLEETIRKRAEKVADEELRPIAHSMALEAQSVSPKELQEAKRRLSERLLLHGSWSRLWRSQ